MSVRHKGSRNTPKVAARRRRLSQTRALRVLKEVTEALNSAPTEQRVAGEALSRVADLSHYQLLRAFMDDATLASASTALERRHYRTHEFGDSMLIEKSERSSLRSLRCRGMPSPAFA